MEVSTCVDISIDLAGQGGPYQRFWMTKFAQIKHPSGYCIQSSSDSASSAVRMAFCQEKNENQIWNLLVGPDQRFGFIRNKNTHCLDLKDDTVITSPCTGSCSQRWWMTDVILSALYVSQDPLFAACDKMEPST